jgi:hypothetical protein
VAVASSIEDMPPSWQVPRRPRYGRRDRLEAVRNSLLATYFDQLRRPARTVYVLDTSGSMAGDRLAQLKAALAGLTGADASLSGQFDRFHGREQVTMLPFDTRPGTPTAFDVPEQDPQPVLDRIRAYAGGLTARGNTALYDALVSAYDVLRAESAAAYLRQLPPDLAAVPVFPVLVGGGRRPAERGGDGDRRPGLRRARPVAGRRVRGDPGVPVTCCLRNLYLFHLPRGCLSRMGIESDQKLV